MKTKDTEALERQRAKPSKFFFNIPLPPDQHHISDVAKWK